MNVTIGGIARTVEITSFDKLGDVKVCMLTTTADGSVGFQQLNQEVVDTIYASFPVDTAKGDIASFEDGADNVPVRELKLNLEPYQNLNGYDSPWVGGAGKNLCYGVAGQNNVVVAQCKSGVTYTFSLHNTGSMGFKLKKNSQSGTTVVTTGGAVQTSTVSKTFTADEDFDLFLNGYGEDGDSFTAVTSQFQLEVGSTATAWTPYENICPIYPATGKNILPNNLTWTSGLRDSNGNPTASGTSHYSNSFPCEPNTTYTGQGIKTESTSWRIYFLTADETWISRTEQLTDAEESFTTPSNCYLMQVQCRYTNDLSTNAQIERGNSPTQYVPYNAIGITRTGANLWDEEWELGSISGTTGQNSNSSTSIRCKNYIPVTPNTTYYMYVGTSVNNAPYFYDANKNYISRGSYIQSGTFTTPNNCYYMRIALPASYGSTYNNDISINYPSSVQTYEPYQCERYYPISANPIYGGTLEVETGVLTVTRKHFSLSSATYYGLYQGYDLYYCDLPNAGTEKVYDVPHKYSTHTLLSNLFKKTTGASAAELFDGEIRTQESNTPTRVYFRWDGTDVNAINAFLATNPLQVVLDLQVAKQYQLTPVQVKTLLGYNNIWTDSGTVEVQYRANIGLYIQKIIGATEDDMVANQNISANKYFFVGEELYYSTSAISAGQTIVVGTNCIKTNLADALNALNS